MTFDINQLANSLEIRNVEVDGETDWFWPKGDNGAWDGPVEDWLGKNGALGHRDGYFKYVKNFGTCLTAGACAGLYTRFYAKKFKRVLAFEPSALSFLCLTLNCPWSHVFKFQAALSDACMSVAFDDSDTKNVGTHKVIQEEGMPLVGRYPAVTIDSLGLSELDFLQLDVEGFEYNVLVGGEEAIRRHLPAIALERNFTTAQADGLLKEWGYVETDRTGHADTVYAHVDNLS